MSEVEAVAAKPAAPEHVAIVGLGPSAQSYIDTIERHGGRHARFDQVWVINTFGDVLQHDVLFFMDNIANVMREAEEESRDPDQRAKLRQMLAWLKKHPGPVFTSIPHPDYPGTVAFPLEEVVRKVGTQYLNNSVAYAVVFAICIGVKKISLYGCDYTYNENGHEGTGRGCTEFWLGVAAAKGIEVAVTRTSTLLGSNAPERRFYGYEAYDIAISDDDERKLTMTPKKEVTPPQDLESR